MFVGYCIITLIWNNWSLTTKEIVEMIFMATWSGVAAALMAKPLTRLLTYIIERVLKK